jgi:glycosyltransferase involved in cell wall biosynthesis
MLCDIDVLLLTHWDWANTGYRFWKCIQMFPKLGYVDHINALMYKGQPHSFQYPEQAPIFYPLHARRPVCNYPIIIQAPELRPLMERSKVIHFLAETFIDSGADLTDKHVVVQTSGSTLRNDPKRVSQFFNQITNKTIAQFPTLLNLGMKNEVLIYYPVDTDFILPDYKRRDPDKLIVGHFPSTPESKGTDVILPVVERLEQEGKIQYIGVRETRKKAMPPRNWLDQLDFYRQCDVIIETIKPELNGSPFGEWGNTALEAAAMGKIVITNSLNVDLYHREYGDLALRVANDAEALEDHLRCLVSMQGDDILREKIQMRGWVERHHSMEATSHRLWNLVYKEALDV